MTAPILSLRPGRFSVDGDFGPIAGYTAGRTWDGWACPYFTVEAVAQIMALWTAIGIRTSHASYDSDADTYTFADDENDWEGVPYTITGEHHAIDGQVLTLYAVGNGCWCWDEE
jgi:hypothetical protein